MCSRPAQRASTQLTDWQRADHCCACQHCADLVSRSRVPICCIAAAYLPLQSKSKKINLDVPDLVITKGVTTDMPGREYARLYRWMSKVPILDCLHLIYCESINLVPFFESATNYKAIKGASMCCIAVGSATLNEVCPIKNRRVSYHKPECCI